MLRRTLLKATALGLSLPGLAMAQASPDLVKAATAEGALSIYSTTDSAEVAGLLNDFRAAYPGIKLEYADQNSTELYNRFISEAAAGAGTADFLWSSAMDLQVKLVQDGYAQPYVSTQRASLPDWAVWKDMAYGTTAEPIVFVYNTRLVPEADVPRTHAALQTLLVDKKAAFQGKVTSYDPERSGVGFLFVTQDAQIGADALWALAKAMGGASAKFYTSSGAMMERIASGEHTIGYNMIGSYALERRKKDPNLGVVLPSDHTLVMSRVAFIPKAARHPNAAKLFLDFVLSKQGQGALVTRSMGPVRTDMADAGTAILGPAGASLVPIKVGPELLTYLDQTRRLRFLRDWSRAVKPG
ncbi:MAG: ABC transporter substrate-binding protein [Gemmatimonadaceae bacterium]|nr:ABC transporter substrate-binding protein [Acetobacteraceae bacterium]